jgi:hypothetical protein
VRTVSLPVPGLPAEYQDPVLKMSLLKGILHLRQRINLRTMKRIGYLILFSVLFLAAIVKSQPITPPDSLLNELIGKWTLNGTIGGQKTTHDLDVQRVLNGQYVQITEVSREKDPTGKPLYEAIVYICWEVSKKQYSCLWLDNTSNEGLSNGIIGRANQNKDKIEMLFKYNETSQFHTTFAYNKETDTWQWLMDNEENGTLQPFARVVLKKND